jgi:hypothetical protein
MSDFSLNLTHLWSSGPRDDATTVLNLSPTISKFVTDELAVVSAFTLSYVPGNNDSLTLGAGLGLRGLVQANGSVALWPGATFMLLKVINDPGGAQADSPLLYSIDLHVPVLFEIVPHFFLGVGPSLLIVRAFERGGDTVFAFRFPFLVGGYF